MFYKERTGLPSLTLVASFQTLTLASCQGTFAHEAPSSREAFFPLVCPGHSGSSIPSSVEFLTISIIRFPSLWVLEAPYTFPLKQKCQ